MNFTIDFETRATVDLQRAGAVKYAAHPETDIWCLAAGTSSDDIQLWIPPHARDLARQARVKFDPDLPEKILSAETIEAHNAEFEIGIWENVMTRYGYKTPELNRWRCSMAKGYRMALPGSLDKAAAALGLLARKSTSGAAVMRKWCKPIPQTQVQDTALFHVKHEATWYSNPAEFNQLCEYCKQDVRTEMMLSEYIPDLPANELNIWQWTVKMNRAGIPIDMKQVTYWLDIMGNNSQVGEMLAQITNGRATAPSQTARILAWLQDQGLKITDMKKDTLVETLESDIPDNIGEVIEIRLANSKVSTNKFQCMADMTGDDDRVRGCFVYHGSSTGRWSARGIQPQNFVRDSFDPELVDLVPGIPKTMVPDILGPVFGSASKCLRGTIQAQEGKIFYCADLSAIEGRVLAWLAGEEWVLGEYRAGRDMYISNSARFFKIRYDQVTPAQRKSPGKTMELACGYQGWINAWDRFDRSDRYSDDEKKRFILDWRNARPRITKFWNELAEAARETIVTRKPHTVGYIQFRVFEQKKGLRWLACRLPSGRDIFYYDPAVDPEGTISHMSHKTGQWKRVGAYGGKYAGNVTQGTAACIMRHILQQLPEKFIPVMTIHDEMVCEGPDTGEVGNSKRFEEYMSYHKKSPHWAPGLPLGASGWVGKRFRKD